MAVSYTQRTLKELRNREAIYHKTESYNQFSKKRVDLFNCIDIVAIYPNEKAIIGIQSTGPNGFSSHLKKIKGIPEALAWINAGGVLELWSWRQLLIKKGGKAKRWEPRIYRLKQEDFL